MYQFSNRNTAERQTKFAMRTNEAVLEVGVV